MSSPRCVFSPLQGLTILLALVSFSRACDSQPLTVPTSSGILTGFLNASTPDVRQFLGIPYALAPLGPLRLMPPVPPPPSQRHTPVRTQFFSPSCMQAAPSSATFPNGTLNPDASIYTLMPQFYPATDNFSEDCLTLNVYAPRRPTADRLPVFVWIHGGGFTGDGSNVPYQRPERWVQRTQALVFVTMNYRLGVFGYPNARGQMRNVGLLDQRLVVEWVRDNIAGFGGDPSRMVLMGQSAGSAAVNFFAYSYVADPIVAGFIAHSGAASILTSSDTSGSNFTALAETVGCGGLAAAEELACMQRVEATELQSAVESNTQGLSFVPLGDDETAPRNATDRLARGQVASRPFIMGNTNNEGGFAATIGGESTAVKQLGLEQLACPVIAEANQRSRTPGFTTYRYLYTGNFSNISPLPWIAACHSCDLPLVFGTHDEFDNTHTGLESTPLERQTSFVMQGLWLAFASNTSADPTYGGYTWEKYDPLSDSVALLGSGIAVQRVGTVWFDGNCTGLT